MRLSSDSFADGGAIPDRFAFATVHPDTHVTLSSNLNPHLRWEGVPEGTRSFAIICHDPDVPTSGEDVNQEGREVPADLPRLDFFHWVAYGLPPDLREIAEGEFSSQVTPGGQQAANGPHGCRQGLNDYTGWFSGEEEMGGEYYGYDGPAPPWNDSIIHHYVFTIYALDTEEIDAPFACSGDQLRDVISPHVLAEDSITGTYTLNPRLRR